MTDGLVLTVSRTIGAEPSAVFRAWTDPASLRVWWGPPGGRCLDAVVDLRVGGKYRIDNELPDGSTVLIEGEFLAIDDPSSLSYTWSTTGGEAEVVSVRFEERGSGTEVIVTHRRIGTSTTKQEHKRGWDACLERLAAHFG